MVWKVAVTFVVLHIVLTILALIEFAQGSVFYNIFNNFNAGVHIITGFLITFNGYLLLRKAQFHFPRAFASLYTLLIIFITEYVQFLVGKVAPEIDDITFSFIGLGIGLILTFVVFGEKK